MAEKARHAETYISQGFDLRYVLTNCCNEWMWISLTQNVYEGSVIMVGKLTVPSCIVSCSKLFLGLTLVPLVCEYSMRSIRFQVGANRPL